jgi:F0F1-type ATP synthase membrane subunit b/b'
MAALPMAGPPPHLCQSKTLTMQQKILKRILLQLRIIGALLILVLVTALLMSFKVKNSYSDVWQQLGISQEKGMQNIRESFLNGYFRYYGAEKARHMLSNDRVAIAKDLMAYAKQQLNSEDFKNHYEQLRSQAKPSEPVISQRTREDIRQEKIAETEKSIRETEANIRQMKPDIAKAMQPVLEMLKNNLKEYKDPNSQMIDLFYQSEKYANEERLNSYKKNLENWEKEYPADYRQLVKRRLQKFIDLAGTVDFTAELKEVNGKKKFVNPSYESKPYDWKQIFRAGKEVIEPAVAFAGQWVKEMN